MSSGGAAWAEARRVYDRHQGDFAGISEWLATFYAGYTNRERIIRLLDYWLYATRCVAEAYGAGGADEFAKSGFGSHIRFAYMHEYGVDIRLKLRRRAGAALFRVAAALVRTAFLPGGLVGSLSSRVLSRATRMLVESAPVRVDGERKEILAAKIREYLGSDAPRLGDGFATALPAMFVAAQLRVPSASKLTVDCAPAAFMDFCGYENLLLLSRPLYIVGRQHGGGYGMYIADYFLEYEQRLCDRFIGWGLLPDSRKQHRYPPLEAGAALAAPKRVVVVERPQLPRLLFYMSPPSYLQYQNNDLIRYASEEIRASGTEFVSLVYPGAMRSPAYDGMRGEELKRSGGQGEMLIGADDVVIFDISGASLIHYCVERGIVFILVVSEDDLADFTAEQQQWITVLREAGLVFRPEERGKLAEKLREMTSGGYQLPRSVAEFHRRTFIDLPGGAA